MQERKTRSGGECGGSPSVRQRLPGGPTTLGGRGWTGAEVRGVPPLATSGALTAGGGRRPPTQLTPGPAGLAASLARLVSGVLESEPTGTPQTRSPPLHYLEEDRGNKSLAPLRKRSNLYKNPSLPNRWANICWEFVPEE